MKIEFKWEKIHIDEHSHSSRAKVIGGWIIHTLTESPINNIISESMIFIPDQNHEWEI
jgi:hypothetical protein